VQIEGSTVPSASDFKGLYFDQDVTELEEEVDKCITDFVVEDSRFLLCDRPTVWVGEQSKKNSFLTA
jgi:hypothetical protein